MFKVFRTTNGTIIAVSVVDNVVRIYDSVIPKEIPQIGTFAADGVSDFNHAMKAALEKNHEDWQI